MIHRVLNIILSNKIVLGWTIITGSIVIYPEALKADQNVGGLGRIVPQNGIINLAGPPGEIIDSVHVTPGAIVKKGTPLISFKGKAVVQREFNIAKSELKETRLSGAKAIEIQKLKIKLQEHGVDLAQQRLGRVKEAGGQSFSPRQMEQYNDELFRAQNLLQAARIELDKMILDRNIHIEQASNQVAIARAKLEMAILTAPHQGTILTMEARPGESTGGRPIVRMADLQQLYVACDIYEGDLHKIKKGMNATISNNALPAPLEGRVESIGFIIDERSQMGQVTIRLLNPASVRRRIHMQVDVSIHTAP